MKFSKEERREENGDLTIIFTFANGKTVELRAADYTSGKTMIDAAREKASE